MSRVLEAYQQDARIRTHHTIW